MFTGIIEEQGTVVALRREGNVARLALRAEIVRDDLKIGDSLATSGVCLTVEKIAADAIWLTMMPETLSRSTLGELTAGRKVNLERALRLDSRLGGHLVSGHVDGVGMLTRISGAGEERVYTFAIPAELARFIAPKGSIAIDGISLTVVDAGESSASVSLIRHTLGATTLGEMTPGRRVNIEVDLIARYLDRLMGKEGTTGGMSFERLSELGY